MRSGRNSRASIGRRLAATSGLNSIRADYIALKIDAGATSMRWTGVQLALAQRGSATCEDNRGPVRARFREEPTDTRCRKTFDVGQRLTPKACSWVSPSSRKYAALLRFGPLPVPRLSSFSSVRACVAGRCRNIESSEEW